MAGKRFVRSRGVSTRRLSTWFFISPAETTLASSTTAVLLGTLNAAALAMRPFTIVRTHMAIWLRSDQAAAVETQSCALGLAVVSDQAVAVGISAVPTPATDIGSQLWLAHRFINADESSLTDRTRGGQFLQLDSKAMRKVEVGQDLAIVAEGSGPGSGMVLGIAGRILIKNT